jgi:hypothetical protein
MVRACCFALLTYSATTLPAQSYLATNVSSKDATPMLVWEKTWGWDDEIDALGVASSERGDICVADYTGQVKGRIDAFRSKILPLNPKIERVVPNLFFSNECRSHICEGSKSITWRRSGASHDEESRLACLPAQFLMVDRA